MLEVASIKEARSFNFSSTDCNCIPLEAMMESAGQNSTVKGIAIRSSYSLTDYKSHGQFVVASYIAILSPCTCIRSDFNAKQRLSESSVSHIGCHCCIVVFHLGLLLLSSHYNMCLDSIANAKQRGPC